MTSWNFADVWETVAATLPDAPAQIHGDERSTWAEFERRADALAAWLLAEGVEEGETFAQYLYSAPPYLEAVFAAFKLGLPPINTNYRYGPAELAYLWDNADVGTVVFHGEFTDTIASMLDRVPGVRRWIWVDDGHGPCPEWATDHADIVGAVAVEPDAPPPTPTRPPWGRSPDQLYLVYTGGTTGLPKGVMWRQDDLFAVLNQAAAVRHPADGGLEGVAASLMKPGPTHLTAAPLMHGTGAFSSFMALSSGGCVVTLVGRRFDVVEVLDTIEREQVKSVAIVGDAFAKPLLAALDAEPGRWDISSLRVMTSSGVMWSAPVKQGLLRHAPKLLCVDTLGSSEAVGMALSVTSAEGERGGGSSGGTASFSLGENTKVITDDGREVLPGSGDVGMVAIRGRVPLGYYKDPEKSKATFREIQGSRWSIPGDYATVEADGSLKLLGRGSVCINTGGEKVYPEEVEEAVKGHPDVVDAVCVGVPDERFGEAVVALVELRPGAELDEGAVIATVKQQLASYKAPKRVHPLGSLARAANGKADYKALKQLASDLS
ncbi:AMP-binding protein [Rhabdothermincola salaria]|uniref:AMP-binding protein n=1 Tax=Rhabdothermincola salaria TaxID=2903142 RepID=UPI001E311320|nr:AMP-binding protein [Rhabdothermincola salaria]MCD9625163.1 AMP-binding protein [Rhabdothermincola salaria]